MNSGHYTAHCRVNENEWYTFSDTDAVRINENEVVTSNAYMLLYEKI